MVALPPPPGCQRGQSTETEVPVDELFQFPPTAPADAPGLEVARLPYKELDGYNVELFDVATDPEMINK